MLDELLDPRKFIGRAPEQVEEFIAARIEPIREKYSEELRPQPGLDV